MKTKKSKLSLVGLYQFWASLRKSVKDKEFDRDFDKERIRFYGKDCDSEFCPLTYSYYKKTGVFYVPGNYRSAAQNLGIDKDYADDIANAADDFYPSNCNNSRLRKIRRKLLKTLKLG